MMFPKTLKRKLQKRNYTNSRFWVLVVTLILLAGCNKKFSNIFDRNNSRLVVNNVSFDYLSSKAKIDYDSENQHVSGTANIRVGKDSVIWISLSPGLGIEAARVLITRDSVCFIDKVNKVYGIYDYKTLSQKLKFDLNYSLVENVIIGNLIYPYDREKIARTTKMYSYDQQHGQFYFENEIGSASMKLEKIQVTDTLSKNSISVNYSDFQLVEEEIFPFLINAQLNYADTESEPVKVSIEYKQTTVEKKPLKFPFNIPQRYEPR